MRMGLRKSNLSDVVDIADQTAPKAPKGMGMKAPAMPKIPKAPVNPATPPSEVPPTPPPAAPKMGMKMPSFSQQAPRMGMKQGIPKMPTAPKMAVKIPTAPPLYSQPEWQTAQKTYPRSVSAVRSAAKEFGLPEGYYTGLIFHESGGMNPRASSSSGGRGLAQLTEAKPGTWAAYARNNLGIKNYNPYDPVQSARIGAHYLNGRIKKFGDNIYLGTIAYNRGDGNVQKTLRRAGIPQEQWGRLSRNQVVDIFRRYDQNGLNYLNAISKRSGV